MLNSILYFEEHCIKYFGKLEDDFLKSPKNFAEYVYGFTDTLCKFGTEMLRDSLEAIDQMLCESCEFSLRMTKKQKSEKSRKNLTNAEKLRVSWIRTI